MTSIESGVGSEWERENREIMRIGEESELS